MIVNNEVNTDLKNIFARFFDVFCFLSLHKFNFIYVIFDYLMSRLLKQKRNFLKDLQSVLMFRVHSFKLLTYLCVF